MATLVQTTLAHFDVTGAEAETFLQNLLSSHVAALPPGHIEWTSLNSPKGRAIATGILWRISQGFRLVCSTDIAAAFAQKLRMYVLRSKVSISTPALESPVMAILGEDAQKCLASTQYPVPQPMQQRLRPTDASIVALSETVFLLDQVGAEQALLAKLDILPGTSDQWARTCIQNGWPWITRETQDLFVPQMINLDLLGGVSFNKGCYPGQEIVARTKYLGKIKKRMLRAHGQFQEVPLPGSPVFSTEFGDQAAGQVILAAPAEAGGVDLLITTQLSSAQAYTLHMGALDGPALQMLELPYPIPEITTP